MALNRRTLISALPLAGIARWMNAQKKDGAATSLALPTDFEAATKRTRDASIRVGNGDPEPMKSVYSHTDDVSIMGALGGYEQGWHQVGPRLDWAAKHFHGTRNQTFERLEAGCGAEFGYEVFLEKSEARVGTRHLHRDGATSDARLQARSR